MNNPTLFRCELENLYYYIFEESLPGSTELFQGYRLDSRGRAQSLVVWQMETVEDFDTAENIYTSLHNFDHGSLWKPARLARLILVEDTSDAGQQLFRGGYCLVYQGAMIPLSSWLTLPNEQKVCLKVLKSLIKNVRELEVEREVMVSSTLDEVFMSGNTPYFVITNVENGSGRRYLAIAEIAREMHDKYLIRRNIARFNDFIDSMDAFERGDDPDEYPWQHSLLLLPTQEMQLYSQSHTFHPEVADLIPPPNNCTI